MVKLRVLRAAKFGGQIVFHGLRRKSVVVRVNLPRSQTQNFKRLLQIWWRELGSANWNRSYEPLLLKMPKLREYIHWTNGAARLYVNLMRCPIFKKPVWYPTKLDCGSRVLLWFMNPFSWFHHRTSFKDNCFENVYGRAASKRYRPALPYFNLSHNTLQSRKIKNHATQGEMTGKKERILKSSWLNIGK